METLATYLGREPTSAETKAFNSGAETRIYTIGGQKQLWTARKFRDEKTQQAWIFANKHRYEIKNLVGQVEFRDKPLA